MLFRAEQIARRVAGAAMAQPKRKVGAAIPLGALVGDRFEPAGLKNRIFQPAWRARILSGNGIVFAGADALTGCGSSSTHRCAPTSSSVTLVKWSIRECRKKVRAVAGDAFMHRASKCGLRPCADARFRIWRDVRRVDHAEWGLHGIATGEYLSAFRRVALRAIASTGENRPFATSSGAKPPCAGGVIGAIADRHANAPKPRTPRNPSATHQSSTFLSTDSLQLPGSPLALLPKLAASHRLGATENPYRFLFRSITLAGVAMRHDHHMSSAPAIFFRGFARKRTALSPIEVLRIEVLLLASCLIGLILRILVGGGLTNIAVI